MKLFSATAFALASLISVSGAEKLKFCGAFPVSYQVLSGNFSPNEVVLHRYCPNGPSGHYADIDFAKHSQDLAAYIDGEGEQFFQYAHFGDRFLMMGNSTDPGTNITLVPAILNMSPEQYAKYQMTPVRIISRQEPRRLENNETYIESTLHVKGSNGYAVKLSPGWTKKLESDIEMLTQTMIPEKGSHLVKQEVTVMRGWLNTTTFSGLHATVSRRGKAFEYITIFLQKPTLEGLMPEHIEINISYIAPNDRLVHKSGKLRPGWLGTIDRPINQMLYYPEYKAQPVQVWPGAHTVNENRGYQATYNGGHAFEKITIYLQSDLGPPEVIPENRAGMYMFVDIVKQVNQTFMDSRAVLSPGWFGELKTGSFQYVKSPSAAKNIFFSGQNATVSPGWRVFVGDDHGFNALYRYDNNMHPISVELN